MKPLVQSALARTFYAISIFCMSIAIILIGKPILAPISLSLILAFVLTPVVRWLEARGVGRLLSVGGIVSLLVILTLVLGVQLLSQLNHLLTELPKHKLEIESKLSSLWTGSSTLINETVEVLKSILANIEVRTTPEETSEVQRVTIVESNPAIPWLTSIPSFITPVIEPLAAATVVIVLVVFMLISREDQRNRFLAIFGQSHLTHVTKIVNETSERLSNFLLGLVTVNFGFALIFAAALFFLGVPYAAVWGAVAFVFRFVPFLGTLVSMLLPLAVSLFFMPGWFAPISLVVIYLTLEGITVNLLEPWLFGKSVGINPLALLIAIIFWTWAWGLIGLMMATPLTLTLVTLGRHIPFLRSLNFLLGDEHPLPDHLVYFQRLLADDIGEAEKLLSSILHAEGLAFVVDQVAIRAMSHADRELKHKTLTSELHRKICQRNDTLLWKLIEATQKANSKKNKTTNVEDSEAKPQTLRRGFGISLAGERTDLALRVIEALEPKVEWTMGHKFDAATVRRIIDEGYAFVLISSLPKNPHAGIEFFVARLRHEGYRGWIAVGNWRTRGMAQRARNRLKSAGTDYASHRLHAVSRMLSFAIESGLEHHSHAS